MDFRFTPEQEALRRGVRWFLWQELPPDVEAEYESGSEEQWNLALNFSTKLAQRGWLSW